MLKEANAETEKVNISPSIYFPSFSSDISDFFLHLLNENVE